MHRSSLQRVLRLGSLAGLALLFASSTVRAGELRFTTTARGRILTTGNTLGLSKATGDNSPGTRDSIGTFTSLDATSQDTLPVGISAWPLGTTSDWTQNGSSAELDIFPIDVPTNVLYAELVWGGSWAYNSENVSANLGDAVTLTANGTSTSVSPDPLTALTIDEVDGTDPNFFDVHYYMRSADVTDFVRAQRGGTYSVSGVPATQDLGINSLQAAGWTLIVVFRDDSQPERNMSVFTGGSFVKEMSDEDYSFSGFCAPPTGEANGRVYLSAIEGDTNFSGDGVSIGQTVAGPFAALSGPNNPVGNFFASQINDSDGALDTRGTFGNVNHDVANTLNVSGARQGWDIASVELSSTAGSLNVGQTEAVIRVSTDGDSFVPTTTSFQIDINAPNFASGGVFSPDHSVVYEGDLVTFTLDVTNTGTALSDALSLRVPLATGLTLEGFRIDSVSGDASMNAVTTADMTTGVDLGSIGVGASKQVEFDVRVSTLPVSPAVAEFVLAPQWSYEFVTCTGESAIPGNFGLAPVTLSAQRLELDLQAAELAGDIVEYTGTISNTGTADTVDAVFSSAIPAGTTYVTGSSTLNGASVGDVGADSFFAGGGLIAAPGSATGIVPFGESALVTYQVQTAGIGVIDNTNGADQDGGGPAPEVTDDASIDLNGDGDGDGDGDATGDGDGDASGDGDGDATGDGDGDATGDGDGDATGDGDGDATGDGDGDGDGDGSGEAEATEGDDGEGDEGTGEDGSGAEASASDGETGASTTSGFVGDEMGGGDGCDCSAEGQRGRGGFSGWLGLGLMGLVARRRRRTRRAATDT